IRLFPISGISLRVARAPSPANGRTLPRPRSYSCDAAASVLVRSGREGTASAVPQPKTFSFLSFRTALAVRNLLLPRAGCPGLAICETWETKSSGALARRFDVGSLACMFRKIRVRVRLQAYRKWHVVNRAFRRRDSHSGPQALMSPYAFRRTVNISDRGC